MDPHVFVVVTLVAVLAAAVTVVTVYARTLVRDLCSTPPVLESDLVGRLRLPDGARLEHDTRPVQLWPDTDAAGITGCWASVWTEQPHPTCRRGSWTDCGAPAATVDGLCGRHAQLLTEGEPA